MLTYELEDYAYLFFESVKCTLQAFFITVFLSLYYVFLSFVGVTRCK